jgi:hypothetical protein
MHIDLVSDTRKKMPVHHKPESVGSLRIWNCRYETFSPVEEYINLKTLVMIGVPDDNLYFLEGLTQLRYLAITNMPKLSDLTPLAKLTQLECVTLEASDGGMGLVAEINSLDPLGRAGNLRHIAVLGIRPRDKSLRGLERCRHLQTAHFDMLPSPEVQRLYAVVGSRDGRVPPPIYDAF